MDRKRNLESRTRPQRKPQPQRRNNRSTVLERRNRRQGLNRNRNRLFRAQNNLNRNNNTCRNPNNNRRRLNNYLTRRNPKYRIIFVANMPYNVDSRMLRNLFKEEGRINQARIVQGRNGSKGYGFVEFDNPRDAWRSIRKWNNTMLGGRQIVVQYRKKRRINNNFGNRGFNGYNNYQRYNQTRQGNNNSYGNGRNYRGGFRPRGGNRYY